MTQAEIVHTQRPLEPAEIKNLQANTARLTAEMRKFEAEAQVQRNVARLNLSHAQFQELQTRQAERQEKLHLAGDVYHHLYQFNQDVTPDTVANCMATLSYWHRTDPTCEMEIRFVCQGGSVISGFVLFDYIKELRRAGHVITTSTLGLAASMAAILLQAGGHRAMGREAWLLIHKGSVSLEGASDEVENTLEWLKRMRERTIDIFVERAAEESVTTAADPITRSMIETNWDKKDWWISSDDALKLGLVDEVR